MAERPALILLVEDNPAHAELIIRNFQQHRVAHTIVHVPDGEEALNYLFRKGAYENPETSPRPHVVFLDLRLPKVDGLEVLKEIKHSSGDLRHLPVVILTTSKAERDIASAYEFHANSYVVKPIDFDEFTTLMNDLGTYWLSWNCQTHFRKLSAKSRHEEESNDSHSLSRR